MRQRQFKWARGCPYIEWRGSHSRWKSTAEKSWPSEEPTGEKFKASVQPVSLCPNSSRWGFWHSIQACIITPMHAPKRHRFNRCWRSSYVHSNKLSGTQYIQCTGACFWCVGSTGAEDELRSTKHVLWNKVYLMHRCFTWDHRFNWWYRVTWLDFSLHPEKIGRQGRRNFRQASDAPMLRHQLNRCCSFSWFSAELTWSWMLLRLFLLPSVLLTSFD